MPAGNVLAGKVALVTGAAAGIGAASARMLAEQGAHVVIADRDGEGARQLAGELGETACAVIGDVSDEAACERMVRQAAERFGRLDIAVNNAGIGNPGKARLADISYQDWRKLMAVNLDGVFFCMKAEIPAMLKHGGGAIINIASVMGAVATTGAAAYVTAKHGVVGLTKAAALDYAECGITVNAIGPAYVDTGMLANRTPEQRQEIVSRHPLRRLATPDEVAAMVCFLASPAARFLTGTYYPKRPRR